MKTVSLLFALLFYGLALAQGDRQRQQDSVRLLITQTQGQERLDAYRVLTNLYFVEARGQQKRDSLFALYDRMDAEAGQLGRADVRAFVRRQKIGVMAMNSLLDSILQVAPEYMRFMEDNNGWSDWFDTYSSVIDARRRKGNYEQAVDEAQKMLEKANQRNDAGGKGMALYSMGVIHTVQRRFTEQEKSYRNAIELLAGDPQNSHRLCLVYNALGRNLVAQKRFEEALQMADENEKWILRYEALSRSPQPWYRLWLYFLLQDVYRQSNDFDRTEQICDKIDSLTNGAVPQYEERAQILHARKQYPEALQMIDRALETYSENIRNQLRGMKMLILIQMGDADGAEQVFRDIIIDIDAKNNLRMNEKLDELRTVYEVGKITAQKARLRNYLIIALVLAILAVLGWVFHSRSILRKNRSLYLQIKAQDRLAAELEDTTKRYDELEQAVPSPAIGENPEMVAVMAVLPGNRQQRQLVSRLKEYLQQNKNYLNPDLARSEILAALTTNKTYLFDAIKAVAGQTPQEYINMLRLEEAKQMLENQPELTNEVISEQSGFAGIATFYRQFREHYQMTPNQYRRMDAERRQKIVGT